MPELAEVEYCRGQWEPGLGKKILSINLHPRTRIFRDTAPTRLRRALAGHSLKSSRAHGKRIFFSIAPNYHLEIHLGMAGRLAFSRNEDYLPANHDHFVLRTGEGALIFNDYRQFGRLLLHQETDPWTTLPPEPLDPAFSLDHLTNLLSRHPRSLVKPLLLDQAIFPGVGNWMADEILWRAGVHPETPVRFIDPQLLRREVRMVCRGAMLHVAEKPRANPSAKLAHHTEAPAWGSPPPTWLFQHRWRDGGKCPRRSCGTPLQRVAIRQRTTCFCPSCQPRRQFRSH